MRAVSMMVALALCGAAGPAGAGRTVVTDTQIEILSPIRFVGTSAALAPSSTRILDAIASTLNGNPSIRVMAVIGYGNDSRLAPQLLGLARAHAVVTELVKRGVAASRLRAEGQVKPAQGRDLAPELLILERSSTTP